jgi:hypothetical protein
MQSTLRRTFARLVDGLPEARYEALLAVLRSTICLLGAALLLVEGGDHPGLALPALLNAALGVASFALAGWVARVGTAERARRIGAWSTAADVVAYAGYSALFHDRPGASSLLGIFVLLEGPIRYGRGGLLATVVPAGRDRRGRRP